MRERLQPILALLDDGLSLYRRNFVPFVLITAGWFVPVAILTGLLIASTSELDGTTVVLLALGLIVLLFPLLIYLIGGLSRAAAVAADGRPVRVREALAIPPLRALSMGCFSLVYYFIAQIVSSVLMMLCICPLYLVIIVVIGSTFSMPNSSSVAGMIFGAFFAIFILGFYVFALIVGGASYSSLIYALQPWVQESLPFGESLSRSFEMIRYRFWNNLATWGLAAVLMAAVALTVMLTMGLLAPLPLIFALNWDSRSEQAILVAAWMIGFVLVLPPLPIWMALLYRRNQVLHDGADLSARVQEWMA